MPITSTGTSINQDRDGVFPPTSGVPDGGETDPTSASPPYTPRTTQTTSRPRNRSNVVLGTANVLSAYTATYLANSNQPNTFRYAPRQVSKIPEEVTLETLIALASFQPTTQVINQIQRRNPNIFISADQFISSSFRTRQIQRDLLLFGQISDADRFRTNALQTRRITSGRDLLDARSILLAGLPPEVRLGVSLLKDIARTLKARNDINKQIARIEARLNKLTALYNAWVNLPFAVAQSIVKKLTDTIAKLSAVYDSAKRALQLFSSAYRILREKWIRYQRRRAQAKATRDKVKSLKERIAKIREIPRAIKFPKRPKLPRLSFSFTDFKQKYKKILENFKNKDGEVYKQAYVAALGNSSAGFVLRDPQGVPKINPFTGQPELRWNSLAKDETGKPIVDEFTGRIGAFEVVYDRPDFAQRAFDNARAKLISASAALQTQQTIRTAAISKAKEDYIKQIRDTAAMVEEERKRKLAEYQKQLDQYKQSKANRLYLREEEIKQLTEDRTINTTEENVFGDKPTGQRFEGRVVYKNSLSTPAKRSENLIPYVLITTGQSLQNLGRRVSNNINTAGEKAIRLLDTSTRVINAIANTANDLTFSVLSLSQSIDDKQIAADLTAGVLEAAQVSVANAQLLDEAANQQLATGYQKYYIDLSIFTNPVGAQPARGIVLDRTPIVETDRNKFGDLPISPRGYIRKNEAPYYLTEDKLLYNDSLVANLPRYYVLVTDVEKAAIDAALQNGPPAPPTVTGPTGPTGVTGPTGATGSTGVTYTPLAYPDGKIYGKNNISRNDSNIIAIQQKLNSSELQQFGVVINPPLETNTGIYGNFTTAAVIKFQRTWNAKPNTTPKLSVDGRVERNTWNALFSISPISVQPTTNAVTGPTGPQNITVQSEELLSRTYKVTSNEVRFRTSPGLSSGYVSNLLNVNLTLESTGFQRRDGRLWAQFKRSDNGNVGWIANTLVLPPPGPFDEQGKLITN